VTLRRAVTLSAPSPRPNVTLLGRVRRGNAFLNEALGVHTVEGLLIDVCWNKGSLWRGLAYAPLRCDINASLPNLDIVANWKDLPNFIGRGRATTVVADPLFLSHVGKNSVWRRYASEDNEFANVNVLDQVADIFAAAKIMLDPVRGTLVLRLGDQVHSGRRQFQGHRALDLAEAQGWLLCDQRVEDAANMPDPKRLHRYHWDSQVHWLVLHTGPRCPGPGLTLPGRARCAVCGRVVACQRVRTPTYCRRPRTCRQAAYRGRHDA
jgi:hypothetical protein